MNEKSKMCTKCKVVLSLNNENFSVFKRSKDGFSCICKPCKRLYDREYRERNKEKLKAKSKEYHKRNREVRNKHSKMWYEKNKSKVKEYKLRNIRRISDYNKKYWSENKKGLKVKVKRWREENSEYIKSYRELNKERDRMQHRNWYNTERGRKLSINRTNSYRAKKKLLQNDFTISQWNECLKHFGNTCAYCGKGDEVLEQEHFVPVSSGGPFTKSNIIPACRSCNASKNDISFDEWYHNQPQYTSERELKIINYLKGD